MFPHPAVRKFQPYSELDLVLAGNKMASGTDYAVHSTWVCKPTYQKDVLKRNSYFTSPYLAAGARLNNRPQGTCEPDPSLSFEERLGKVNIAWDSIQNG
jgi:hypothetical protein